MGDEKQQILKMVADGVITAEDGVKLLEALDRGDRRRKDREHIPLKKLQKHIILNGLGDKLAEIGPLVRTAVCEAFVGVGEEDDPDEEVIHESSFKGKYEDFSKPVELPENTVLLIRNRGGFRHTSGNLELTSVEGNILKPSGGNAKIAGAGESYCIRWNKGNLSLEIPSVVTRVQVDLKGAEVTASNMSSEIDLRIKGGNIFLDEQGNCFSVRTMGGNVSVVLTDSWHGESQASTMGGNIALALPDTVSALIDAATMGGHICADEDLGEVNVSGSHARGRVRLLMGDDEDRTRISLKTMGGNISISGKN
jgi:DUF4097 and DUF4098 domain-containing protein YvlB